MQLLTKDSNAKIKKTNKLTKAIYEFYNSTLTSRVITKSDGTTFDPCPNANLFGCRDDCLRESGRGIFSNVRDARNKKLEMFYKAMKQLNNVFGGYGAELSKLNAKMEKELYRQLYRKYSNYDEIYNAL